MEQVLAVLNPAAAYFWSVHSGAELDLLFFHNCKRYGMEFKYNEAPKIGRSMYICVSSLELEHLWVVTPGNTTYPVDNAISVAGLSEVISLWLP